MAKNLSLPEIYQALPAATFPKKDFVKKIMDKTHRSKSTVEKWLRDTNRPSDIKDIQILCEMTGLDINQLYK